MSWGFSELLREAPRDARNYFGGVFLGKWASV